MLVTSTVSGVGGVEPALRKGTHRSPMNSQYFVILRQILSYSLLGALFLGGLGLSASASAAVRGSGDTASNGDSGVNVAAVGRVKFMLGKAYVEAREQSREVLRLGSVLREGDRITTGTNGHVHIQFEDDAFVSVRPNSRLEIVKYEFNAERPELSSVKFNLQDGVARAISGKAAKSAREQFRLNTPIAAIGVRGTDFVVSATDTTVRALVNEGIIVMAPFSVECSADGFGPCGTNGVELAGQSMQILEQDGIAALPRLLPAPVNGEGSVLSGEAAIVSADAAATEGVGKTAKGETFREVVELSNATAGTGDIVVASAPTTTTPPATVPQSPAVPDFTPTEPVTAAVSTQQLVWGRYAATANPQDLMTLSFAEASANRKVTVGNLETGLFRDETSLKRLERGLGAVSFQLNSAQAYYDSASGVVAMQVNGGSLAIDFQGSNFATELNLNHSLTGPIDFVATGRLFSGGYFHNTAETQRIAGAVSFDATEAGYFFERQLEFGNITGLTLWNSQ